MPMKVKKNVRDEIRRPRSNPVFLHRHDRLGPRKQEPLHRYRDHRRHCRRRRVGLRLLSVRQGRKGAILLAQGIRSYQEYVGNPQGDALARTERTFQEAAKAGPAGVRDISRLYLARIALLKGSKEEARRLYSEVNRSASVMSSKSCPTQPCRTSTRSRKVPKP